MAVQQINQRQSTPYVLHIDGQPLFGIIANVQDRSDASAFSTEELNKILFSGMHQVEFVKYEQKERDHSEVRERLLKPPAS